MNSSELKGDFGWAVRKALELNGPPEKVGSFTPELFDLATDADGRIVMWNGKAWQ